MANLIEHVLLAICRVLIWRWASALALAIMTGLDRAIPGRRMKLLVGGALGLAAYILVPIFQGLFGF